MKILFVFVGIIILHALYNLINFWRYPIIEKNLLKNYSPEASERMEAALHRNQILNYIKYSGVKDTYIPVVQPVGYLRLASGNISMFNNILNSREDIAQHVINSLLEAKGNYWSRFINSFNPFYWLRIAIFIPKYLFSYLGLKEESIIIKIFQIIYWLLAIVCTFLISIFPEEIKAFIFSLLHIS